MRKLTFIALLFLAACNEKKETPTAARLFTAITPSPNWKTIPGKEWYFTATKPIPVKPGDTVLVGADYNEISLNDVNGMPGKPIVFIRVGTPARVGKTHYGNPMVVQRCSYLVFDNFDVGPDSGYAAQGWNIQSSHNIEIRNFKLHNASVGFFTNPATGVFPKIWIHDGEIFNIGGPGFCEAIYAGRTSGQSLDVNSFPNCIYENLDIHDIGGDGIQLANHVSVIVRNNRVVRYGTKNTNEQWFAYLCGGGTSGLWENNHAEDGPGSPFEVLGTGVNTYRNNTAVKTATGDKQDLFYIRQSFPTLSVGLFGNRGDSKNRNWVFVATVGVKIDSSGNVFGSAPTPPPVVRVDSVTRSSYDSLRALRSADSFWKAETVKFVNRP